MSEEDLGVIGKPDDEKKVEVVELTTLLKPGEKDDGASVKGRDGLVNPEESLGVEGVGQEELDVSIISSCDQTEDNEKGLKPSIRIGPLETDGVDGDDRVGKEEIDAVVDLKEISEEERKSDGGDETGGARGGWSLEDRENRVEEMSAGRREDDEEER